MNLIIALIAGYLYTLTQAKSNYAVTCEPHLILAPAGHNSACHTFPIIGTSLLSSPTYHLQLAGLGHRDIDLFPSKNQK